MAELLDQCRYCRREGEKLYLKGDRCNSPKCSITRRNYAPGMHGMSSGRKKVSDYGTQLREKQKVKRTYGVFETQFANYYKKAEKKQGVTGELLLQYLEMRLDNIAYRMGLADSRREARQIVGHGHLLVNGKKIDIPSYEVREGDKLEVNHKSKENSYFKGIMSEKKSKDLPDWINCDITKLKGEVKRVPTREELDQNINEQLIVELYSK